MTPLTIKLAIHKVNQFDEYVMQKLMTTQFVYSYTASGRHIPFHHHCGSIKQLERGRPSAKWKRIMEGAGMKQNAIKALVVTPLVRHLPATTHHFEETQEQ